MCRTPCKEYVYNEEDLQENLNYKETGTYNQKVTAGISEKQNVKIKP